LIQRIILLPNYSNLFSKKMDLGIDELE